MTARLLIKCDGPECKREIDSTIHAGTWLTLKDGDIFTHDIRVEKPDKHFCSYICIIRWCHTRIEHRNLDTSHLRL